MSSGSSAVTIWIAGSSMRRLTTRPNAPCAPYSASSTTVFEKLGSSICGIDTSRTGAREAFAMRSILLRAAMLCRMTRRLFALIACACVALGCHTAPTPAAGAPGANPDSDLLDVSVTRLHQLYAEKKYTVTQVVQWHLDRIDRYNGVYGAIEEVFRDEALVDAKRQDADAQGTRGALWGVPIVIKANTSIKGHITSAGWEGFTRQGHELVAPQDAPVVARL